MKGALDDAAWLEVLESTAELIEAAVRPLFGTEAGRREIGRGAGGDRTVELDRVAEEVALSRLQAVAEPAAGASVLSEEAGLVDLGAEWPRILVDPVDGSLNAKRGLPVVGTMLTLLRGPTVGDAAAAHVRNLVSGEGWSVVRGGGLRRNGRLITPMRTGPPRRFEVLALESGPRHVLAARPLIERASKIRLFGSMALSLAHTAAGGVDVHFSGMAGRVFDMSAGALMLAEVGGVATDGEGRPLAQLAADLRTRTTLLASAWPELHALALDALRADAAEG